ncbi:extracellular catalytic domain type 1 short-chain-length polyhydroxyalkanoate depolymerase [Kitasatospora kifunensis]|uniref:Poly(Hydroxyalkanoate) depolymerase family esterase n=1 Tax=Kitasatospora kifunensis TaxID=58351 RepID=A0A7W7RBI8_KITKI|nr:PHB depolymerase family esterase [Kitasatospora kifunensis]MBB4928923.1 poly(hydroxyalkanoate) depolymerase family esterase [Kitasatospora kifunensis]
MSRIARRFAALLAGALLLVPGVVAATPASAAGLTQVTGFGSNPGSLNMYSYLPANLPSNAPLVLALHGCTQSANDYYSHSGWPKIADTYEFAVVFPEQPSLLNPINNCFDWGTPSNDSRGQGEALSVYQMVQYAETNYHVNPSRIYITGLSAGAGMTADLLADYPDVFAAGSIDSGPAAQCSTSGITNSNCTSGSVSQTPQQWGDLIRNSDSGYTGPYPRVAIWQGSADTTVNPAEMTYNMDGWTNVWGISQTPSSTQSLTGGTTESSYNDSTGKPAVQTYSVSGMTHGLAVDPGSGADQCGTTSTYYLASICSSYYTAKFFGLDQTGTVPTLPAPTGLAVTGTTSGSVSLSWGAVSGAASYDVYRNGTLVNASAVTGTAYTDSGLTAGTGYSYAVAAVDASGSIGAQSAAVNATTTAAALCFTDNNYNQTVAGRAYQSGGYTYANGSNQNMGLWNLAVTHTLKETSANYYVIADGQC